jgi:tyrosyl-tRNA synthetase
MACELERGKASHAPLFISSWFFQGRERMTERSIEEQVDLLMQGTYYGDEALASAMGAELGERLSEAHEEGRPLRVYCGFDPRTSDLHLGHTVPMRKMRQFQELGHEVTMVIGRFTSLIGDPSDKDKVRAQISLEQATVNAETYAQQAAKILNAQTMRIEYNDSWLSQLSFADVIEMGSIFTIQQFLTRETFRNRFDEGDPIYLHEFFYALMQAYDAYHLGADVQIGGSDQLFNIVTAARKWMETKGVKPNIPIILGILPGTDGEVKMSKSLGNHIPLKAPPEDMYGKVMSIPDKAMGDYFRLLTRWTPEEIERLEAVMASGEAHPRDVKMRLAHEVLSIYHGEAAAAEAEAYFRRVFQDQGTPEDMHSLQLQKGQSILDVLHQAQFVSSNSEGRRLAEQGGIRLEGEEIKDVYASLDLREEAVLRVGKRRFLRLIPPED